MMSKRGASTVKWIELIPISHFDITIHKTGFDEVFPQLLPNLSLILLSNLVISR